MKKKHTPARRKRLERRFNEALRQHQAGDLAAAEKAYRQLIEADPEHGYGLHYLGLILRQRGQEREAIELMQRASLTPQADAALMNNLGSMLCDANRREESIAVFARGVELEPDNLIVRLNLAGMLLEYARPEQARVHYQVILERESDNPQALIGMGRALLALAEVDEAIVFLRKAIQTAPQNSDAHIHLARALIEADRLNEAFEIATQAQVLAPRSTKAMLCLGSVQMTMERYDLAEKTFRKLLKWIPNDPHCYGELIHALVDAKREAQALEVCDEAFKVIPDFATGYANQGNALKQLGRLEEAVQAYRKAIEIDPGHDAAYNNMGTTYVDLGDMAAARQCFEKALELSPELPEPLFNLTHMKKSSSEDMQEIHRLEALLEAGGLMLRERVAAHNALGKAYDDCRLYEKAFYHYQRSNELKRRTVKFVAEKFEDWVRHFPSVFSEPFFQKYQGVGDDSPRPIFIVGMPRSGTTLVEQIVSSHSRVFGADELTYISEMTEALPKRFGGGEYPQVVAQLTGPMIRELADDYLQKLLALDASAEHVTDKMPSNYYHLGLLAVMFPRCHIIHCQRDPMDTCFSNFIQLFGTGHYYSYSLDDIAVCYRAYERLMAHWRAVLPVSMFEVRYEDLVENQERVSRSIIDYLGLEWDAACLSFYQNRRAVRTASHWQVRQPIYRTARQRWKNYAPYLEKLRRDIGYCGTGQQAAAQPS